MPLPSDLVRSLSDKVYDRRKGAALQVETIVRALVARGDAAGVEALLEDLARLAQTQNSANARKGGALALAAAAVALAPSVAAVDAATMTPPAGEGGEAEQQQQQQRVSSAAAAAASASRPRRAPELVTGTLLSLLGDRDARVRYYAAEGAYNVARVASRAYPALLDGESDEDESSSSSRGGGGGGDGGGGGFWREAFAATLTLASDADPGVRQAGLMLDGALRDCCCSCFSTKTTDVTTALTSLAPETTTTRAENAQQRRRALLLDIAAALKAPSAAARRTATAWTATLCRSPEVDLVPSGNAFPELVGGLLDAAASDNERSVKQAVAGALARLRDDAEGAAKAATFARELSQGGEEEGEGESVNADAIDVAAVVAEIGTRASWRPSLAPTPSLMDPAASAPADAQSASPLPPSSPPPAVALAVASARAAALDTLADWASRAPTAVLGNPSAASAALSVSLPALSDPDARVSAAARRAEGALLASATRAAAGEAAAALAAVTVSTEEGGRGEGDEGEGSSNSNRLGARSRRRRRLLDPVAALDAVFAAVEAVTRSSSPSPPAPPPTAPTGIEAVKVASLRWATALLRADFATASAARAAAAAERAASGSGSGGRPLTSSLLLRCRGCRLLSETLAALVSPSDRLSGSALALLAELARTAAAEEGSLSLGEQEQREQQQEALLLSPRSLLQGLASALADPCSEKRLKGTRGVAAIRAVSEALPRSAAEVFSELAGAISSITEGIVDVKSDGDADGKNDDTSSAVVASVVDQDLARQRKKTSRNKVVSALSGASAAAHTLVVALATAPEAGSLRSLLAGEGEAGEGEAGDEGKIPQRAQLFEALASAASPSLHATLSLCLLSRSYELATEVISAAASCRSSVSVSSSSSTWSSPKSKEQQPSSFLLPPSVDDLVSADALARSLDAPHFTRVRLSLLSEDGPKLARVLRALLCFLPLGDAFRGLEARLKVVNCSSMNEERSASVEPEADYARLLELFKRARRSVVEHRLSL